MNIHRMKLSNHSTVFWRGFQDKMWQLLCSGTMQYDVVSEQMAVKLGMLMQDQLLIPKILKSHFGQKFELLLAALYGR